MPDSAAFPEPTPLEAHPDYEHVTATELQDLNNRLQSLLKLRTLPISMKQFRTLDEMNAVQGLRRPKPGRFHTMCQLVTQCRMAGLHPRHHGGERPAAIELRRRPRHRLAG